MRSRFVITLALSVLSALNASPSVDVTTLGVKNDGTDDVSDIVNAATESVSLYFPAGIYKVAKPLRLKNSIRGDGFSRFGFSRLKDGNLIEGETGETLTVNWRKGKPYEETYEVRPVYVLFGEQVLGDSSAAVVTYGRLGLFLVVE